MEWLPKKEYHEQQIKNLELALKKPETNHEQIIKTIKEHKEKLEALNEAVSN